MAKRAARTGRQAMTITQEDELDGLKLIGRIVANTMQAMARAPRVLLATWGPAVHHLQLR